MPLQHVQLSVGSCRKLEKLQEENHAMEEELSRRAASADAGAQLVADQQRFLQEKKRVRSQSNGVQGIRAR